MARLIDADELIAVLRAYKNYPFGLSVDKIPTVSAIPIDWIKKQLKEEEYRTFLVDYIEWGNCLRWLIEKWEKENE